jgi:hypothetical protein
MLRGYESGHIVGVLETGRGPATVATAVGRNSMASRVRVVLESAMFERRPMITAGDLSWFGRCDRWLSL